MSILMDWDMPIACRDCRLQYSGWCHYRIFEERRIEDENLVIERPDWCQLIEIPTPHGRLIDVSTVEEIRFHDADGYHVVNGEQLCELEIEAKTVIGAEE